MANKPENVSSQVEDPNARLDDWFVRYKQAYKKEHYEEGKRKIESYQPFLEKAERLGKDVLERFQGSLRMMQRANEDGYTLCPAATIGFTHPQVAETFEFTLPSTFLLNIKIAERVAAETHETIDTSMFEIDGRLVVADIEEALAGSNASWITLVAPDVEFGHLMGLVPNSKGNHIIWDTSLHFIPLEEVTPQDIHHELQGLYRQVGGHVGGSIITFRGSKMTVS